MPAAKMLADSTQSDAALERKKRRRDEKDYHHRKQHVRDGGTGSGSRSRSSHSSHRNSHSSNHHHRSVGSHSEKSSNRKKEEEEEDDDSDNSDMDLNRPLKPIRSYITNRTEMLDQMLHCIKGNTLKRAIPDDLQSMSHTELKQRCLAQLEVMSKKRILRILSGDDPANISSSGTEESGDDIGNTDKKITMDAQETSQPYSNAESHPADSTSSSMTTGAVASAATATTKRTKSNTDMNSNLSLVSPSIDGHLLPQPVNIENLGDQSRNIQVSRYSYQNIGSSVSTSCPDNYASCSHWLQPQCDQSLVTSLQGEAEQLQSRSHFSAHLLPHYRHTLEVDCSDVPINIAPTQTRRMKNVSIHSSLNPHHHKKSKQWDAASSDCPFACSGSDYCICGRCPALALQSQAAATTYSSISATNVIGIGTDTHTPVFTRGGPDVSTEEQVAPTRVHARTQMEILELEMRARAIKAMLEAASHCPPLQQQQPSLQHKRPPPSF